MLSQDSPKKLFLLDGYALIFRAYYAFIKNPRINSKGLNTSAMFGFTNTILEIINNEKPTHMALVLDPPTKTIRTEMYADYKANRDETPEDIKLSVPYIKRIAEAFGLPIIIVNNYEADDVIGTLVQHTEKDGFLTYMMTPDKDYGQLVTDKTFMYRPGRFGNPAQVWGIPEVQEKFSVSDPKQVIDILGLWGDSVDNIPGIPGIGEKTAKKYIKKYGSVEELIANVEDLKGKQKENVTNFAEQGLLSKQLATIILDVPVEYDPDAMVLDAPNPEKINEVFEELEFRTLLKRVLGSKPTDVSSKTEVKTNTGPVQGNLFDTPTEQEEEETTTAPINNLENTKHNYKLVQSETEISDLIALLEKSQTFCFDTETSALDPLEAELVGIAWSVKVGEAFYTPIDKDQELAQEQVNRFKPILENASKQIVAQNLKYDLKVMRKYNVEIAGKPFDTMLAHYLINPDMKHNMDLLAKTYLNYEPVSIETLIGKKGKSQGSMADLPPEEIKDYAAEDADITLQLKENFEKKLDEGNVRELFENIEQPLIKVLANMELEGVNLDQEALHAYSAELGEKVDKLEKDIKEQAGEDFNVDSPKQLGPILFEKLKITEKAKKTKTGQYATGEEILSALKDTHPIVPNILSYRMLRKLKSTYVDPLPGMVNNGTNRLHTNYMQTVAATGRLSSNNPNLQNIPIRTAEGREIRKAFIPKDNNHILLAADYSQVELRIIAALSEDEGMMQAFIDGEDIHTATASKVFGVDMKEVDREMRSKAKAVNFGIIYGQGAFGLAQNLKIKRGEAKEIIENYFAKYSRIRDYMAENKIFAQQHGYVETIMGRRRYLPDIRSNNAVVRGFAERNAINAPIQGSAADVIKVAMINIDQELTKRKLNTKMIMQVHDELVFDTPKSELEEVKTVVTDLMQNAVKIAVPLKVDIGTGANWLEAH